MKKLDTGIVFALKKTSRMCFLCRKWQFLHSAYIMQ